MDKTQLPERIYKICKNKHVYTIYKFTGQILNYKISHVISSFE